SADTPGQYGMIATATADINLAGSAGNMFKIYNDDSSNHAYILLQDGSDTNLSYCEIYYMGVDSADRRGITVDAVNGAYGGGEGLTIDNCLIHDVYQGVRFLPGCSDNVVQNTTIRSAGEAGIVFLDLTDPNITVSNNIIYNSSSGIIINNSTGITVTDCALGTSGQNSAFDVNIISGFLTQATFYNTAMVSPNEINGINLDTADSFIISGKHDQVDGLTRVWGDWKPAGVVKFRYDSETYSGAGDANTRKVLEFSPTTIGTQYYADENGDGIELVGTALYPTLVRSADGGAIPYDFTISAASGTALFGGYYYEFQHLNTNGLYIANNASVSATGGADSGLDFGSFKNNPSATRHLNIATGQALNPVDGCSFDTSTSFNVRVDNTTNLTLTDYINTRDNNTYDELVSGSVTWTGAGANEWVSVSSGAWDAGATWDEGTPPAAGAVVVITDTYVVILTNTANIVDSLTVDTNATLTFDLAGANPVITFTNGGALINNGTINFANAGSNYVSLHAQTPNQTKWIFSGNQPDWSTGGAGLEVRLGDCDFQTALNNTGTNQTLIFDGQMETDAVQIVNDATLTFQNG
ncbi:MAG: right-handed parallel beta-helix repeat-containing protein, partial [Gammaproteobacteria bacterium]|nr:right-handed parallel beta-helix repeat-containing protein [Gammaproteobacteria bacterium]